MKKIVRKSLAHQCLISRLPSHMDINSTLLIVASINTLVIKRLHKHSNFMYLDGPHLFQHIQFSTYVCCAIALSVLYLFNLCCILQLKIFLFEQSVGLLLAILESQHEVSAVLLPFLMRLGLTSLLINLLAFEMRKLTSERVLERYDYTIAGFKGDTSMAY